MFIGGSLVCIRLISCYVFFKHLNVFSICLTSCAVAASARKRLTNVLLTRDKKRFLQTSYKKLLTSSRSGLRRQKEKAYSLTGTQKERVCLQRNKRAHLGIDNFSDFVAKSPQAPNKFKKYMVDKR